MKQVIFENQSKVFERTVRGTDGRLFRVRFVVVEREGQLRGRVVSCIPLNLPSFPRRGRKGVVVHENHRPFWLASGKHSLNVTDRGLGIRDFYVSPYFNIFELLTPIKIRAPAYIAQS